MQYNSKLQSFFFNWWIRLIIFSISRNWPWTWPDTREQFSERLYSDNHRNNRAEKPWYFLEACFTTQGMAEIFAGIYESSARQLTQNKMSRDLCVQACKLQRAAGMSFLAPSDSLTFLRVTGASCFLHIMTHISVCGKRIFNRFAVDWSWTDFNWWMQVN